jgi:hypothetical protein
MAKEERDSGYSDSPGRASIGGGETVAHAGPAGNHIKGHGMHERQCTGGCMDNTPGQVGMSNVDAMVHYAETQSGPKGLDSMGGTEYRGKGNSRDGSGY